MKYLKLKYGESKYQEITETEKDEILKIIILDKITDYFLSSRVFERSIIEEPEIEKAYVNNDIKLGYYLYNYFDDEFKRKKRIYGREITLIAIEEKQ